ncbi:MAG: NfeD family protein [Cellvibrio sp.]
MDEQWLQPWHWFFIAGLIFFMEILGVGGFFLGAGVAALVIGIALLLLGWAWQWQIAAFATLAIIFTIVYYKKFRRFNLESEQPELNSGAKGFIGRQFYALHDSINHRTKVQIGDALWTVVVDAKQGQPVRIINAEGVTLYAEVVDDL